MKEISAIITTRREDVSGGTPVFVAKDEQEMQDIAFLLEKILDGMVHEIAPRILVIVRHK
ncbi:capping complex subunit for YIEGIA [Brevibacillus daliensis]|uniref:capping complex subunit for YIEGIA n=1 Tax=Brevibacillus daliensis TaxID=2892995 RepID=UPI001E58533E|nr:hypothetical protein [Brevibacillus daliensis]